MELGEASELVTLFGAAFPRRWRNAEASEVQLWTEMLIGLDYSAAYEATSTIIRSAVDMPSFAEFRSIYRSVRSRGNEARALQEEYEHDPRTPREWEQAGERARLWRSENYPQTHDPATEKALPRNRQEFGIEWATWFRLHFGWAPHVANDVAEAEAA